MFPDDHSGTTCCTVRTGDFAAIVLANVMDVRSRRCDTAKDRLDSIAHTPNEWCRIPHRIVEDYQKPIRIGVEAVL